jgi:GxxExxY protein
VILELGFRIDILVEDTVIIELKSVEEFSKVHYKQLLTYLKLANREIGILVNFNSDDINENTKRIINNYYQD